MVHDIVHPRFGESEPVPILLRGEADEAHLKSGGRAGCGAPREKAVGCASSAGADGRDVRRRESSTFELIAHDGAQVDERLAGTPYPFMVFRSRYLTAEAITKLGVNFETTLADRRTHRSANVGRSGAELEHRANAGVGDIRDNAAPSGMERAGYFASRINDQ